MGKWKLIDTPGKKGVRRAVRLAARKGLPVEYVKTKARKSRKPFDPLIEWDPRLLHDDPVYFCEKAYCVYKKTGDPFVSFAAHVYCNWLFKCPAPQWAHPVLVKITRNWELPSSRLSRLLHDASEIRRNEKIDQHRLSGLTVHEAIDKAIEREADAKDRRFGHVRKRYERREPITADEKLILLMTAHILSKYPA